MNNITKDLPKLEFLEKTEESKPPPAEPVELTEVEKRIVEIIKLANEHDESM